MAESNAGRWPIRAARIATSNAGRWHPIRAARIAKIERVNSVRLGSADEITSPIRARSA
jgi:hypothetical protein